MQQSLFIFETEHNIVEINHGMQMQACQLLFPFWRQGPGVRDEIEHRDDRFSGIAEQGDFIFILAQYGLADIDDVKYQCIAQQLANDFGFLFEFLKPILLIVEFEKTAKQLGAIRNMFLGLQGLYLCQQSHGIFQTGGVIQAQCRLPL